MILYRNMVTFTDVDTEAKRGSVPRSASHGGQTAEPGLEPQLSDPRSLWYEMLGLPGLPPCGMRVPVPCLPSAGSVTAAPEAWPLDFPHAHSHTIGTGKEELVVHWDLAVALRPWEVPPREPSGVRQSRRLEAHIRGAGSVSAQVGRLGWPAGRAELFLEQVPRRSWAPAGGIPTGHAGDSRAHARRPEPSEGGALGKEGCEEGRFQDGGRGVLLLDWASPMPEPRRRACVAGLASQRAPARVYGPEGRPGCSSHDPHFARLIPLGITGF